MSADRRVVRTTLAFFEDLDRQLRPGRGPNGEPSAIDFQTFDLLEIVERFATDFDDLPELIPGRPEYRLMTATGRLVAAYSVIGQLAPDGAVELLALEADTASGWD